jgi:ATP-dependent RNA helicase DDX23/PRP28
MAPPSVPGSGTSTPGASVDVGNLGNDYTPSMTDTELAALRSRYLGVDKKKRKIRKMNDRKFVFDWDEHEDTFAADAPASVGALRQGAQVMFGRGRIAGMDDGASAGAGSGATGETVLADAMERRKAMKAGYDDRHWTDKPLPEMKERDWRIFREDFSIAARGAHSHFVLRSLLCVRLMRTRWKHPASITLVGRVAHSFANSGDHREDWVQGAVAYPAAGDSHRPAEPRHYWYRRDR